MRFAFEREGGFRAGGLGTVGSFNGDFSNGLGNNESNSCCKADNIDISDRKVALLSEG